LAQSGHFGAEPQCPLSGVNRTSLLAQVGVIAMIVWLVLASDYRRSQVSFGQRLSAAWIAF